MNLILTGAVFIGCFIITHENDNNIPTAPLLTNYYKNEIRKLDIHLEKIAPSMDKWFAFQCAFPYINPELYAEKSEINKQIIEIFGTFGTLSPIFYQNSETHFKLIPKTNKESITPAIKKAAEELPERVKEIDERIHYEMKREFLKRIQSGAL